MRNKERSIEWKLRRSSLRKLRDILCFINEEALEDKGHFSNGGRLSNLARTGFIEPWGKEDRKIRFRLIDGVVEYKELIENILKGEK